ncbi:uncharacterized membrane protein YhaH (DUF805 family) [Allocatelliglobosispora scoriae]|uniref:Uncharacterized membrane protein YhaH (DUF805 family) n=1 Tax=Allocatelliglobosispora scoriae TaxID=643052 RepID=A0A841BNY2_9ACTN|nr:DUF4386 domain-containing protein [Allocatelliglobosispora scoriae]MBB5868663.1 uncharacterized membrane protein YhaH (DUF805 family) [Allocatelliglobosispora scoriae]
MSSPQRLARIAGFFYLLLAVFGGFAELFARSNVVEPGNAAATADNIVAHATLFRIGFVSDLIGVACFPIVAMLLHRLLRHVSREGARAMLIFVIIATAITGANLLNHFAALTIATDPGFAAALGADGSDALVLLFTSLHSHGYLIAQVFFGLWLLPLGWMAYTSGLFPKALGVTLMLGCVAYLVDLLLRFLAPALGGEISAFVLIPSVVAEFWMVGYLLIKGVRATA